MIWPVLRALCEGELTPDQVAELLAVLELDPVPRTEGPATKISIAHRSFDDGPQARLVVDFSRLDENGWVLALFAGGEDPSDGTIEAYRARFRQVITRFGLTLIEISPPATADEVFVFVSPEPEGFESGIGYAWDPWYSELERLWRLVGLSKDAPREVKLVKLNELMRTPLWAVAPADLRHEVEAFLAES